MRFEANFSLTADFEIAQRADMCMLCSLAHARAHSTDELHMYIHVCDSSQSSNNEKRTHRSLGGRTQKSIRRPHLWDGGRGAGHERFQICVRGRNWILRGRACHLIKNTWTSQGRVAQYYNRILSLLLSVSLSPRRNDYNNNNLRRVPTVRQKKPVGAFCNNKRGVLNNVVG